MLKLNFRYHCCYGHYYWLLYYDDDDDDDDDGYQICKIKTYTMKIALLGLDGTCPIPVLCTKIFC